MMVDALVLAGADTKGSLAEVTGEKHEALIDVCGKPMLEWILLSLKRCPDIGRTVVVGPTETISPLADKYGFLVSERGTSIIENIERGVAALKPEGLVLVVTADIPFITPEAISDFLERCSSFPGKDVYYPLSEKATVEKFAPGVKRTYVKIKGNTYTGGNIIMLNPKVIPAFRELMSKAVSLRKKPLEICKLLGLGFIIKFVLHSLKIEDIERRVQKISGLDGKGIVTPFAEIGIDVDKPSDLELARSLLSNR